ncbi:hypothetical protein BJ875DRAFT_345895, partial [Amylocarpus encephaloides]
RQEQEQWAQQRLSLASACVSGFAWGRVGNGYRCCGENHYITDQLLAEGRGGFYTRADGVGKSERWSGPLY